MILLAAALSGVLIALSVAVGYWLAGLDAEPDTLADTTCALADSEAENARLRRELALATEQRAAVVASYRRVKADLDARTEAEG